MATWNTKTTIIDNMVTTTWYDVRRQIVDQVFQITPFYDMMVQGGRIRERIPDGTHWEIPVRYAQEDSNTQWFGRGAKFGRGEKETLTRLIYESKNLGTAIVRFFDDDRKNKGKAKLIDYVTEKVENTKMSLMDRFETDLLVQNSDPLAISALPTLISTTPTSGSIGGLTRSANAYLQNNTIDFTGKTTTASLIDEMTRMYNLCSLWKAGGRRSPDVILTTRQIYQDYEAIARAMATLTIAPDNKSPRANLGFGDLTFKNVEMFWAPNCPSGAMYFLNTDTLELAYDPEVWFEMTEWKTDPDSLDRVAQIVCVCNLLCTNFRKNGVIYNVTTVSS